MRNVLFNLLGTGAPLLIALWAIPLIIKGMGKQRFGLLTIIWMSIGYFSLFDLGIGSALTKLVAERLNSERVHELPVLISTSLKLMLGFGILSGFLVFGITPWLVGSVLNIPSDLQGEAVWSFRLLAASLPFVISSAGLIAVLQAYQRFGTINAVRIPLGVANFLGPLLALMVTSSLVATTITLAVARIVAFLSYSVCCYPHIHNREAVWDSDKIRELLSFGGWITVSNIISPLMVYFDRFIIGAALTMTAVTYYTTPYEVVTRLWVVPNALAGVLFPALTTALVLDLAKARMIFDVAGRLLLIGMFPLLAMIVLFAPEGLTLWLGADFARESASVLRWLAIGVFVNCAARLPLIILQGTGRPDITAKLHLAELPIYLIVLWLLMRNFGITGVAIAFTLRIIVDTIVLFLLGICYVPQLRYVQMKMLQNTIGGPIAFALLTLPQVLLMKWVAAIVVLIIGGGLLVRELYSLWTSVVTMNLFSR